MSCTISAREITPAFVAELARVVRPGGLVVVFEHNPLNPLTRLVVSRVTFDDGVRLLRSGERRLAVRDARASNG